MPEFQEEYFEDEVLEGFYVPSMIKRCWAAELEVLYEFDRICQKYNIMYFANWGTLLAAVRHGGMMPWDDDVDVVMTRNEFERFFTVAQGELPSEYHFVRFETSKTCWQFIINLMNSSSMRFDPDYMERHHGFPYMAGLDIFILDHYCPNEDEAEHWRNTIKRILVAADLLWEERLTGKQLEKELCEIEQITGRKIHRSSNLYDMRMELYIFARNECAKYNGQTTKYVSQMLPWGIFHNRYHLREDYEYVIRVPFENMEISIPLFYNKLLTEKYNNYFYDCKNGYTAHGYPYYEEQRKALGENVDFVPQFHFSRELLKDGGEERIPRIKRISMEYDSYFKQISAQFRSCIHSGRQFEFGGISIEELMDCQSQAITYGQYLEEVKGEGAAAVKILEQYCEAIYRFSEILPQSGFTSDKNDFSLKLHEAAMKIVSDICRLTVELSEYIRSNILDRTTVMFVPYKAKHWQVFHSIWQAAKQDPQCDVYVVPSPYQYIKYDGTPVCSRFEQSGYPKEVAITPYPEFDFEKAGADIIYFQNPYDNYNMAVHVSPQFYSSNLKQNCKKLVYIPYFREDDFVKSDEKQYYNMRYYCTMPGVVNADKIILASEALKLVYVQKLCDFAGEDTKGIWESKILAMGASLYQMPTKEAAAKKLCEQGIVLEPGKWVVYYISISALCEKRQAALEKMDRALECLCQHRENISCVWVMDPAIRQYLDAYDSKLAMEFYKLAEKYKAYIKIVQELRQAGLLADFCDAYYGDPSVLMHKFVQAAKPVMVCNYDA